MAGTIGLIVKFSTLQEYGVDKPFFLENHNIDSSQRNIVFMVRGEDANKIRMVAGMLIQMDIGCVLNPHPLPFHRSC